VYCLQLSARLTDKDISAVSDNFGDYMKAWLFGFRTADCRRSGGIDLHMNTHIEGKSRILNQLMSEC
jgi:hypothetical protein